MNNKDFVLSSILMNITFLLNSVSTTQNVVGFILALFFLAKQ